MPSQHVRRVMIRCVRQFLIGWITHMDSVPDIELIDYLPEFLDGLFNSESSQSLTSVHPTVPIQQ